MDKEMAAHEGRMTKAVEAFQRELGSIRAGKATPALLDNIRVDYYGTPTPLKQVASVSAPEPRLLIVQPWEKNLLQAITKAIQASDLGLNPQDDGNVLKIPIPTLNEERRKELVKLAHKMAEEGRVAVRNVRRDANEHYKKAQKNGDVSEDDARRATEQVQKLHDKYIAQIDDILKKKEAEVMEV
jgi:ribosome recycling factor